MVRKARRTTSQSRAGFKKTGRVPRNRILQRACADTIQDRSEKQRAQAQARVRRRIVLGPRWHAVARHDDDIRYKSERIIALGAERPPISPLLEHQKQKAHQKMRIFIN